MTNLSSMSYCCQGKLVHEALEFCDIGSRMSSELKLCVRCVDYSVSK